MLGTMVAFHKVCATEFEAIGPKNNACAGILLFESNAWTGFNHAASMPSITKRCLGIMTTRKFNKTNFQSMAIAAVLPYKKQHWVGLGVFRFGDAIYNFSRLNMAYAKQIGLFSLGISTELLIWHVSETSNTYKPIINLGGRAQILAQKLWIGAQTINLLQTNLRPSQQETIPSVITIGMYYKPQQNVSLLAAYEIQTYQNPKPKLAIDYTFSPPLKIQVGIVGTTINYHAGFALTLKNWLINYAIISHPQLNFSQSIGLTFTPPFSS